MGEITLVQAIGQLRSLRDRCAFTRDRVGQPGCRVRMDAADDVEALDAAINLLSSMTLSRKDPSQ